MDVDNKEPEEDEHHHSDEPWVENIFKTNGEMPLHSPEAVVAELANVNKDILVEGKGNNCLPDDFAKINYKAFLASSGKMIEDTHTRNDGKPSPKRFIIGHFDVIKCFDLILPQMKQGEVSKVFCPSKLVYGHLEKYS